ncbi:hypothetical protein ACFL56_03680 [Candidatus Margulisiibacteriota bacterium]
MTIQFNEVNAVHGSTFDSLTNYGIRNNTIESIRQDAFDLISALGIYIEDEPEYASLEIFYTKLYEHLTNRESFGYVTKEELANLLSTYIDNILRRLPTDQEPANLVILKERLMQGNLEGLRIVFGNGLRFIEQDGNASSDAKDKINELKDLIATADDLRLAYNISDSQGNQYFLNCDKETINVDDNRYGFITSAEQAAKMNAAIVWLGLAEDTQEVNSDVWAHEQEKALEEAEVQPNEVDATKNDLVEGSTNYGIIEDYDESTEIDAADELVTFTEYATENYETFDEVAAQNLPSDATIPSLTNNTPASIDAWFANESSRGSFNPTNEQQFEGSLISLNGYIQTIYGQRVNENNIDAFFTVDLPQIAVSARTYIEHDGMYGQVVIKIIEYTLNMLGMSLESSAQSRNPQQAMIQAVNQAESIIESCNDRENVEELCDKYISVLEELTNHINNPQRRLRDLDDEVLNNLLDQLVAIVDPILENTELIDIDTIINDDEINSIDDEIDDNEDGDVVEEEYESDEDMFEAWFGGGGDDEITEEDRERRAYEREQEEDDSEQELEDEKPEE